MDAILRNENENKENEEFFKRHEEYQYLDMIKQVIRIGKTKIDRTNVGTVSMFGTQSRYTLRNSKILNIKFKLKKQIKNYQLDILPLLTTKKVFTRGVIEELLWFIKGSTNAKELSNKNIRIWDGNSSREFLDKNGFHNREEGNNFYQSVTAKVSLLAREYFLNNFSIRAILHMSIIYMGTVRSRTRNKTFTVLYF
jgi:thymidylate synthase